MSRGWDWQDLDLALTSRQLAEQNDPELRELRGWAHLASMGGWLCKGLGESHLRQIHRRRLLRVLRRRPAQERPA